MKKLASLRRHDADIVASLAVFVIAVPLSLGIALASGTPIASGLIAAVVGGIVVGLFTGAPLTVSGPAAGLTALVLQYVNQFGLTGLAYITCFAGVMQVMLGLFRAGRIFSFVPSSILNGMLAAIGLIIAAGQIHIMFGSQVPKSFLAAVSGLPQLLLSLAESEVARVTAGLGAFAIALQLIWPRLGAFAKKLPAALPAVIIVTLVGLPFAVARIEFTSLTESVGASLSTFASFAWWEQLGPYFAAAIGLALVASAESLLTSRAIHSLAEESGVPSRLNLNQELKAQGVGNLLSGVLGGLPITGVIVRSAANLNFGAKSQLSTILHGVWIIVFFMAFPNVVTQIPLAALAAVLILTGVKLLNAKGLMATWREDKRAAGVWAGTMVAIVVTDLLTGLVIGGVLACAANIRVLWPQLMLYLRVTQPKRVKVENGSADILPADYEPDGVLKSATDFRDKSVSRSG